MATTVGSARWQADLYDVPETTRDGYGQTSQAPTLLGTYWAEVIDLAGSETVNIRQTRQVQAHATHVVTLRRVGSAVAITPLMKFIVRGQVLNIVAANLAWDNSGDWVCQCIERVGATS